MNMEFREGKQADFEDWFAMQCACEKGWHAWRDNLEREWNLLFGSGEFLSIVIEDTDRPEGQRLIAFGGGAFVSDAFVEWLREKQAPYVRVHLTNHAAAGLRPLLNRTEIARANGAGGLNFFLTHWTWAENLLSEVEALHARVLLTEQFHLQHGGYNLHAMLVEGVGEEHRQRTLEAGFELWNDYACHYAQTGTTPASGAFPFLMGITREEVFRKDGSALCRSFLHTRPRFRFTEGEQKFLCQARFTSTDDELMERLDISRSTVKKRWREIYARVGDVLPQLLPVAHPEDKRGKERRRILLDYLRQHPEELRPYKPAHRTG